MATETKRIYDLLQRDWNGPMWHGPNLSEVLNGIDWQKAFAKPGAGSHNIYELVRHMSCWRKFVLEHLNGNTDYKVELNSETDRPTQYEKTEASWKEALAELDKNQADLLEAFQNFDEQLLNNPVPGKKFNWYTFIHGLIHHDIYHSGQISILKK